MQILNERQPGWVLIHFTVTDTAVYLPFELVRVNIPAERVMIEMPGIIYSEYVMISIDSVNDRIVLGEMIAQLIKKGSNDGSS